MRFYQPFNAWNPLILLLITFPLVALCASRTAQQFRNELTQWLDQESVAAHEFAEYRSKFGINEYVLMSWPGCILGDERLMRIETDLSVPNAMQWVEKVSSGPTILQTLVDEARITEQQAKRRLTGIAIGTDGESTGVFLKLSEQGRANRADALAAIKQIAGRHVDQDQIYWAGLGHDLFVLDDEGFRSPFRMVPWIILTALTLTWFFVRDFRLAFFINLLGIYCGCLSFTFIYFTGFDLNAIVWPLPTLMMLLTISASLHFLGYYRSVASRYPRQELSGDRTLNATVVQNALSDAWRPTLCCAVTTAVGLLSLTFSHTQPVRQFGWFGSVSILVSSAIMLLSLPAWLSIFPPKADRLLPKFPSKIRLNFWPWLAHVTRKHRTKIITTSVLLMAVLGCSISNIRTGGNLTNFFPKDHRVLSDSQSIEDSIGPLSSIELLLEFQHANSKNDVTRIRMIDALGRKITSDSPIESVVSAATFAPNWRKRPGMIQRVVQRRKIERLKEELIPLELFHVSSTEGSQTQTWRMSLRYSGLGSPDVAALARRSSELAEQLFHRDGHLIFEDEGLKVTASGEFVVFDDLDRQFLNDLITTYSTAFVLVIAVVLIILRSVKGSVLVALPNLLPAVLVFGAAGLMKYTLDVASLMTASVALGIAVDDTLHMLIWWRKRHAAGGSSHRSLVDALNHCGTAVVQTSVVCGFSIGLYAFCGFLPTVRFGILLLVMLLAALIGDLVLLPALLSTSLARKLFRS